MVDNPPMMIKPINSEIPSYHPIMTIKDRILDKIPPMHITAIIAIMMFKVRLARTIVISIRAIVVPNLTLDYKALSRTIEGQKLSALWNALFIPRGLLLLKVFMRSFHF
jgi:hypothetical protein